MRNRTLLLVSVLVGIGLASLWQQSVHSPGDTDDEASWSGPLPSSQTVAYANRPAPRDSLSETEVLYHIERLYRLQADLMRAEAAHDGDRVESILHTSISELEALSRQPGLVKHPRFRSAFRGLTTAYESRYGVPDTLQLPDGEIYDLRDGLFSSINRDTSASLVEALPADLRAQDPPIPLTLNQPVKETITFLLSHKELHLYPWLRRASTYFPMIEQIFAEEGVPDELKYLAIAESGLDPYAQSRADAAGIWQFVEDTGRQYGLSIDPWVDERLDPEKATRAAAQHLKDLHDQFGDWQLALAGYNCNPGVVEYHVYKYRQRTGRDPSFWDIYDDLPEETRNYVPLYTATALIISNPTTFDLERVQAGPRYAFDYVPVDAPLTIGQVARLAEVDREKLHVLNPELRSNRLPPSEEPYYVRLPYGTYDTFSTNFAALPEEKRNPNLQHVLQAGESIGRVAQRYHVDRSGVLAANDTGYPITMQVGQPITIPEKSYAGNRQIAQSADTKPFRVRYGSRTVRPIAGMPSETDLTASLSPGSRSTP